MLPVLLYKALLKADILVRREFEIIPVNPGVCCCRASDPLFRGCRLSGVTRERHPASQSELYLCMPKSFSAYKGTARYPLTRVRIRAGASLPEVFGILRCDG